MGAQSTIQSNSDFINKTEAVIWLYAMSRSKWKSLLYTPTLYFGSQKNSKNLGMIHLVRSQKK